MADRQQLERDVEHLAGHIGERNVYRYPKLVETADFIERVFREHDCRPWRQQYDAAGIKFANLEATIVGRDLPREIVVIGAHYDTVRGSPGANDNATGVAALLGLMRMFAQKQCSRTLRFVAFTNEERPFLRTKNMGSRVYARGCRGRQENVKAMLSLETIGYCSSEKGSQWLSGYGLVYPSRANFIVFVANHSSKQLLKQATDSFRRHARVPYETATLPGFFPGAKSSDHWSFWKEGYPGLMVTDTAPLRYRHYHRQSDTPDKIRFDFLTDVVEGLEGVVSELAGTKS